MIRPRLSPWKPGLCRGWTAGAIRTLAGPYTGQADEVHTSSSTAAAGALKRPRAKLVNGRAMATEVLNEVRRDVDLMRLKNGMVPGLAVIMVGERRDSAKYVSMKQAVAKSIGFESFSSSLPATATHSEVLECIQRYNGDPRCHGILLQLPVPAHLDPRGLLGAIKVEKDVECFNPTNAGRMTAWRRTVIAPCTPLGVMEMLLRLGVDVRGKHAVVLGESSVVGLPMCLLLNEARATVTMVHKETPNPEEFTRRADIVVAATGVPDLVRASWVKPGAVVIDVGINFVRDDGRSAGFRVAGDVHRDVRQVASIVSPVPGGVGPMTVAMLMRNCANMAFLQSRWGTIARALHPELAAENARRMDCAVIDLAMSHGDGGSGGGGGGGTAGNQSGGSGGRSRGHRDGVGGDGGEGSGERRLEGGGAREVEVAREALERAGESITDAELLTIINDSEKNAHDLLSFLELGSFDNQLVDPALIDGVEARAEPEMEAEAEAGAGVEAGAGAEAGEGAVRDKRDRSRPPALFLGAENAGRQTGGVGGEPVGRGGGGGGGCAFDSGEEGAMKALDEWHLEAERAAKARGEAAPPQRKAEGFLLEDDMGSSSSSRPKTKTNSKWWVHPLKGEETGQEEASDRQGGTAAL